MSKKFFAELIGTFLLVFLGTGAAVLGGGADSLVTGFLVEVILTFIFILVILTVTSSRKGNAQLAGLVIGLTLTLIHFVGIPVTGMSANPARSLAPALLAGGDALSQIWIFILAPIVGGVLASIVSQSLLETE